MSFAERIVWPQASQTCCDTIRIEVLFQWFYFFIFTFHFFPFSKLLRFLDLSAKKRNFSSKKCSKLWYLFNRIQGQVCYILVVSIVWARILWRLAQRDSRFRMTIILGAVLIRSLVFPFVFRDVSGTDPEWPWSIAFRRNSSSRDRAPKSPHFVLLNSWDNFHVTLPSISSETCVIISSCAQGTFVFRAWLLLGCSS